MPIENVNLLAFNRGLISRRALARIDLKKTALSAEVMTNWMARTLGNMGLRVGAKYLGSSLGNNSARYLPFIRSVSVKHLLEFTDGNLRIWQDDAVITRPAVTTTITNGLFNTDLTGWTDADESGATSAWVTGGYMGLTGTGINVALRTQQVTVSGGNINALHALRIKIARGPIRIRIGSSSGDDDYFRESVLRTGEYSIAFTPSGNFHIWLFSDSEATKLVESVAIESSGTLLLPAPYAEDDLKLMRYDQSGDVIFLACEGYQQKRVEFYGGSSWGITDYAPEDGPFRAINTSSVTLIPSALTGNITLTASFIRFQPEHVGALFRITSIGQNVIKAAAGNGQWSDPIKVTGIGSERNLTIDRSGTWAGTLVLQRSVGSVGSWVDTSATYTSNGTTTYNDGYDNQIMYYRIGFNAGYTSGTATLEMSYANGGLTGVVRITDYTSATEVDAEVLKPLGATTASVLWSEGAWSDFRGWPSSVAFHEGRLFWAGKDNIWGSVSDAYESFDDEVEGDSAPISKTLGSGPVDNINWLISLGRLVIGGESEEKIARSSSLDEPLTATNFNLKSPSSQGSAKIQGLKADGQGFFVQRGGTRLFSLSYQGEYNSTDYSNDDITIIAPEVGDSGFVRIAVQRQPDTRIHCVRNDGKVAIVIYDKAENVQCWSIYETDGIVEDVVILPGDNNTNEDNVYYLINRTINGSTVRYLEKWALESECVGGVLNKQADSFKIYSGGATTTITGLGHLEGKEVVVWADGLDIGTKTVSGGQITLTAAASNVVVGLPYTARYKSTKLAYASGLGTALTQKKRLNYLGLIMINTHAQGLRYGPDFDSLDDLPQMEDGAVVDVDSIWDDYDKMSFEFPGDYDTDSRLCLEAAAPRPCNIVAAVLSIKTNDRV